jgi:hypothetical protein
MTMKKLLLGLLLSLMAYPALAQSPVVTKAPPVVTPGYSGGNGFYFGVGAEGSGTTIANAPAPGTVAVGGDLEAVIGYGFTVAHMPLFVDASIGFQNLNAGSSGFALSGPAHAMERIGIQAPLAQLLPIIGINPQTISIPVLPPGVTVNGSTQSYWFGGALEDDVSASVGAASGRQWLVSAITGPGLLVPVKVANWDAVIDVWAGLTLTSSGLCIGTAPAAACPQLGTGARTGVRILF